MQHHLNMDALQAFYPRFDAVLSILPGAAIAGGFLRDTLMDRPVGDLDIFWSGYPSVAQLKDLGRVLNVVFDTEPDFVRMCEDYNDGDERESEMENLFSASGPGGSVDLICVPSVLDHVHDFPDNISKIWYSATAELGMGLTATFDFVEGHADKRIMYRISAPLKRLEKLQAKYPDYQLTYKLRKANGEE